MQRTSKILTALCLAFVLTTTHATAEEKGYPEGSLIVRFAKKTSAEGARGILDNRYFDVQKSIVPSLNLFLVKLKDGITVRNAISLLSRNREILYSQPDHFITDRADKMPNDAQFASQWSLHQSSRVDISAPIAWNIGTGGKDTNGNDVVVAIVDGGMDIAHPDLLENLWVNSAEIAGNAKDDDGNGYVDDVNGWNAYSGNGVIPARSHGTHVAGIAGARGNNSIGVAGVNWDVKLMAVAASSGTTSVIAEGYGYVLAQKKLWLESKGKKGANVVVTNSSFGVDYAKCDSGDYPVWNDLYEAMGKSGILSAAATANLNIDVDTKGDVPTGCSSEYIVSVTNTTNQDLRHSSAAYGRRTIDLGAPGTDINSTYPNNTYARNTGTSMATPHVAGAIAFLHSVASKSFHDGYRSDPGKASLELKRALMASVDPIPAMAGATVSGGRLNLAKAAAAMSEFRR